MVSFEEYFDKLLEAHTNTGHGGRGKMLYDIKINWRIYRLACEIFATCTSCNLKRLLNYQDHGTKFLHLLTLKTKHAVNDADELSKIFFTFGAPSILQSDNGTEFVASVINEIAII